MKYVVRSYSHTYFQIPRRTLYSDTKQLVCPQIPPRVTLVFAKTHLYPAWKLHPNTSQGVIGSIYIYESPTLGAYTHAYTCPWALGGHGCDIIGNVTIIEYMDIV